MEECTRKPRPGNDKIAAASRKLPDPRRALTTVSGAGQIVGDAHGASLCSGNGDTWKPVVRRIRLLGQFLLQPAGESDLSCVPSRSDRRPELWWCFPTLLA